MPKKDPQQKANFNLEVIQLKCDHLKSNFDSFVPDLTSVFVNSTIVSCFMKHSSGCKYHLFAKSESNQSHKVDKVNRFSGNCVNPEFWKGFFALRINTRQNNLINLVRQLCLSHSYYKSSYCAIWRFNEDPNFFQLIEVDTNIQLDESSFPSSIYSFSLGNIINGNSFMIHFGPFCNQPPIINKDKKTEISTENIKIKHKYNKAKFVLKFNLKTSTNDSNNPAVRKYRFVYDYKSIKRVHICLRRKYRTDLYIHLYYPPRIYVKQPDAKTGVLKRCRTSNCGDKLSKDVIGYSNVLRLLFNLNDDSILSSIHAWQKLHNFDITYGSISEFYMKPFEAKYTENFPFSVNYALKCIYSIGYNFLDDLRRNHEGEKVINGIIMNYIKADKEVMIVEALYRLFDDYLLGKVYNSIEHLNSILHLIESESVNGRNKHKSQNETNYFSWIIITPTRTIFTPPIAYYPWQCKTSYLIKIILRDENFNLKVLLEKTKVEYLSEEIPYTARSDSNDKFLDSVAQTRLFNSGCLSIAGHSYNLPELTEIPLEEFKQFGSYFYEIIPKIKCKLM